MDVRKTLEDQVGRRLLGVHEWAYKASHGRVGHSIAGVKMLLLSTTGAKTGLRRTHALLYVEDEGNYAVFGSNGGAPAHPAWYHNLRANPEAEVQLGREVRKVRARDAEGDERDRIWKRGDRLNRGGYSAYQTRTERRIPVVVLDPL